MTIRIQHSRGVAALAAALLAASAAPASAGLTVPWNTTAPTPPPAAAHAAGKWDWQGPHEWARTMPYMAGIADRMACRYVGPAMPFEWKYTVENHFRKTVSFDYAPLVWSRKGNVFITPQQVFHTTLRPGQASSQVLASDNGCPNMKGGDNPLHFKFIILDNVRYGGPSGQLVRSGVYAGWNQHVNDVTYQIKMAQARQAIHEGEALSSMAAAVDPSDYQIEYRPDYVP
jgi:hypothetical protein